ncbi:MAG: alpha/beta hydrolase [Clostridia bacterium]|nr:alpha/beta hydrolase [Clostridia bacterium]
MNVFIIILCIMLGVIALLFIIGLIAMYFVFFFSPKFDRENPKPDVLMGNDFPRLVKETDKQTALIKRTYPHESVSVTSDDGLKLYADFYINERASKNTIICVHGYNSCGYHDFSRMVEPILNNAYNCLLIDQRHYGKSEGKFTGFGLLECRDVLKWIELVNERFPGGKIVLYGVSMGAATVMQTSKLNPPSVVGIVEDCGFTSCKEEFAATLKTTAHLPAFPLIPILSFWSKLFLGLSLGSDSRESVAATGIPMLFIHGTADTFIPYSMCEECFKACNSEKQIKLYAGAGHAQSHFTHPAEYERDFFDFVIKVM